MISPKLVSRIIQARTIMNCEGPLDENEDYSERKHNPRMPRIIPTKKPYHDWRGKPSPIGDVGRSFTGGQIVPINNGDGGPFDASGNDAFRRWTSKRWW
jgi:hypothetical protein